MTKLTPTQILEIEFLLGKIKRELNSHLEFPGIKSERSS